MLLIKSILIKFKKKILRLNWANLVLPINFNFNEILFKKNQISQYILYSFLHNFYIKLFIIWQAFNFQEWTKQTWSSLHLKWPKKRSWNLNWKEYDFKNNFKKIYFPLAYFSSHFFLNMIFLIKILNWFITLLTLYDLVLNSQKIESKFINMWQTYFCFKLYFIISWWGIKYFFKDWLLWFWYYSSNSFYIQKLWVLFTYFKAYIDCSKIYLKANLYFFDELLWYENYITISKFFKIKYTFINAIYLKKPAFFNLVQIYNQFFFIIKTIRIFNYIFFYNFCKSWLIAVILSLILFNYFIIFYQIIFFKQIGIWFIFFNLIFWLFSGFNFFLKRYKFGKFTSSIQRFWKRTNAVFWLIEGFLFILFFYYYLNASQESTFFLDFNFYNKYHLLNLIFGYKSLLLITCILYCLLFLQLNLCYLIPQQVFGLLLISSSFICYVFFLESYQFYYLLTSFFDFTWIYNDDLNLWILEMETPKMRVKYLYFILCLIAKYWHFLFIFITWFFILMKIFENYSVTYNLVALNFQNFLLLYGLTLICFCQHLFFIYRRFFNQPYTWFLTNLTYLSLQEIVWLIYTFLKSMFEYCVDLSFFNKILNFLNDLIIDNNILFIDNFIEINTVYINV